MIQLFHEGTSHVHNGITCEMATVNEYGFEHLLDDGWCFTPEECYPSTKEETPKVADSKVTAPETSVSDKALKAEKPDKTTTKTAAKK